MKTMNRFAIALTALLTAVAAFAETEETRISIKGSNTFGEQLGPALIEAFKQSNPDVAFELGTEGSGSGMLALLNGECDLASASRIANEDERRMARTKNLQLRSHFIGSYGVSVVVYADNPLRGLTMTQIRDIFTGTVKNWKQVGGPDAPINVYIRDPVAGTYLGFQELAMERRPYVAGAKPLLSYPAIVEAIAKDKHGIGYVGMTLVPDRGVRALLVNGIPGNILSVNEGMYPYARGVRFYTVRGRETDAVWAFIRYVRSAEGQAVLQQEGFVPRAMQLMDAGGLAR